MTGPVLELDQVTKSYPGGVQALQDVSLRIEPGELLAIVGPSGSGKSTLLHVMGTLDRPTSGTVRVAGQDVAGASDRELAALRAEHLGFVFQSFFLLDGMTAQDNVAEGLLYTGLAPGQRRERAREALTRVGMEHRLHHVPATLSGGERQRVAIARALAGTPSIVLADEPTGNLDSARSDEVVGLLRDLHAEGTTIAVITHDAAVADALGRRVTIRDGRLV